MRLVVPAVLIALSCAACSRHGGLNRRVSYGDPTSVRVEDVPVRGFGATVTTRDRSLSGELLAVDQDHLYLLDGGDTLDIPTGDIEKVTVDLYPSQAGWILVWTLVGIASTLSHGRFLLITAPTWLVVGGVTAGTTYAASVKGVHPGDVVYLWQFARFPAGLPKGWPQARPPAPPTPDAPPYYP